MDPDIAIALSKEKQRAMNLVIDKGDSPVQQFYEGTTVFITGGTGFLGKQLIEKLFRACKVSNVYLLIRGKKGKSVQERLVDMWQDPVFDLLREKQPKFMNKITLMIGDVAELDLGLSEDNRNELKNKVDIIFHVAATTKFDESLMVATLVNIRGTREALALGKDCKKLKSFVHVSTAFVNATEASTGHRILEEFHPCPLAPDVMIRIAESMDGEVLASIADKLIKGYPNTYTFAKSLAEQLVKECEGIPICVVRPAIVIASYREPIPGWVDMSCAYGASGLILGPATGLIHVLYGNNDTQFSLVPVDYVNNAIIVAGAEINRHKDIQIYTVSGAKNLFLWATVMSHIQGIGARFPPSSAAWYIFTTSTSNKVLYWFLTMFLHYIPGFVLDALYCLLRKPAMFTKLYKKVYKTQLSLSYFTSNTWIFDDTNTENLYKSLTKNDQAIFDFNTANIDQKNYLTLWCNGITKYLMKDTIKNVEFARKKQFCLWIVHCVTTFLYIYCFWKIINIVNWFFANLISSIC